MNRFFSLCVALAVVLSVCIGSTISFAASDDSFVIGGIEYKAVTITPEHIKAMFDAGDFHVNFEAYSYCYEDDCIDLLVYDGVSSYDNYGGDSYIVNAAACTIEGNLVYFWYPCMLEFDGKCECDSSGDGSVYRDGGSINYQFSLPFEAGRFVSDGSNNLIFFEFFSIPPTGDFGSDTYFTMHLYDSKSNLITQLNPTIATRSPVPTVVQNLFSSYGFSSYMSNVGTSSVIVAPNYSLNDVTRMEILSYYDSYYYDSGNKGISPLCFGMTGFTYYVPDVVIEHTHSAVGSWSADDGYHWQVCSCGEILNKAAHTGGTATETQQAICSVCSFGYGELVTPEEPHTPDGIWHTNDSAHWQLCSCGEALYTDEHSGGTATTTQKAICSICGVEYGELLPPSSGDGDSDSPTYADLVEEYLNKVTDPSPEAQEQVNQLRNELKSAGEDLRNAANGLTVPVPDVDDFYEGLPDEALGGFGYWATYVLGPMMNLKFVELLLIGLLTLTGIKLILFGSGPH